MREKMLKWRVTRNKITTTHNYKRFQTLHFYSFHIVITFISLTKVNCEKSVKN